MAQADAGRKNPRHHLCGSGRSRAIAGAGTIRCSLSGNALGSIATNGIEKFRNQSATNTYFRWGNDATSLRVRKAKNLLKKQIEIIK